MRSLAALRSTSLGAVLCAGLLLSAALGGAAAGGGDKEAVGFDEVIEEPKEPGKEATALLELRPDETGEPEPLRPAVLPAPPTAPRRDHERPKGPPGVRRLSVELSAGGLLPVKGRATVHEFSYAVGARASVRLGPRAGLLVVFDYSNPGSDRGASRLFLVQGGLRFRLAGEDVSNCPLYAGLSVGVAAESVTDDYEGELLGNLGFAVRIGLGVRLTPRLGLGIGYVVFPDSENSPGVGLASLGYSF